jgi:multiple sugar transport system permease protein
MVPPPGGTDPPAFSKKHADGTVMDAKPVTSKLQTSTLAGWLMAAPAFILIGMFIVIPFFFAFGLSFTNQRLISPNPTEYVGAGNFKQLLGLGVLNLEPVVDEATKAPVLDASGAKTYPAVRSITRKNPAFPQYDGMREWFSFSWGDNLVTVIAKDVIFMKALVNTFIFVIVVAPLQGGIALMLALMINQKLPGINIFRTIYFMPVVVSIVVVALLWRFIYDGNNGLLNTLLNFLSFGLFKPVDWLGQSSTALGSIIAMSIWQAVGFHMVIWLSGLQTIPATLYEAADIEGATGWQKFSYITWPGLRNTAVLVLIVITMQAFSLFAQVDVMTSGGPVDSTQSVVYQAVQRGYAKQDIAAGSTIAVILFVIVLSISLIQRFLTRERK